MNIELSVIIPAFNSEKFLLETVNSVINQNLVNFEIVIGDDCSSDRTQLICKELVKKYSFIKYFRNSKNLSEGANRNNCISLTKGEYIFPLDHDNILPSNLLNILLNKAKEIYQHEKKHYLVSPQIIKFFKDDFSNFKDDDPGKMRWIYRKINYNDVLTCQQFCPSVSGHYLYHRSIYNKIGGYLEDVGSLDDLAYGVGAYVNGFRYLLVKDTFYYHRIHDGSMWVNEAKNLPVYWKKFFNHYNQYYTNGELLNFKESKLSLQTI